MQRLLAKKASDLARRIYASLPWGVRVANFFLRLGSGIVDAFGQVAYAEFIKRGITGLPDIGNDPAASWQERLLKAGPKAGDRVPRGYGRKYAQMIWNVMLSKTKNPEMVEELMTWAVEHLIAHPAVIKEGVSRQEAEAFVLMMLKNKSTDMFRSQGRRKKIEGPSTTVDDEGEQVTLDVMDPNAFKELAEMMPEHTLKAIVHDLEALHPNAAAYIDLAFQGYEDREIAQNAMLPNMDQAVSPQALNQWKKKWLPRIQQVVMKYLDR